MPTPRAEQARHEPEPVYLDDVEAGRARHPLPRTYTSPPKKHHRGYGEAPQPRRANTYRAPRRRPSFDDMPPRRHRHREPRSPSYDDDYSPAKRPHRHRDGRDRRDDGYYSDNRHERRYRDAEEKPRRKERRRDEVAEKPDEEPRWRKEAKNMFKEYAVPAIKAEGGKLITKEIAKLLDKK